MKKTKIGFGAFLGDFLKRGCRIMLGTWLILFGLGAGTLGFVVIDVLFWLIWTIPAFAFFLAGVLSVVSVGGGFVLFRLGAECVRGVDWKIVRIEPGVNK